VTKKQRHQTIKVWCLFSCQFLQFSIKFIHQQNEGGIMRRLEDKAKVLCSNFALKTAHTCIDSHDHDTAIAFCSLAIKTNPQNAFAYALRGSMYNHKHWCKKACRDLNKAVIFGLNDEVVYSDLGYAHLLCEEFSEAVNNFSNALVINPNHFFSWAFRGYAFSDMGLFEKAVPDLIIALTLIPNDPEASWRLDDAYLGRGKHYLKAGRNLEAVEDFSSAMNYYDFVVEAYEGRASAYTNLGMLDLAKADVVKAKFFRDEYELNQQD